MLELQKNSLNFKDRNNNFKPKKKYKKVKRRVNISKKVLKYKAHPFKFSILKLARRQFSKKIVIRITSNNIFCTLIDFEKNKKTLHVGSGGKYRIKTSKKKVRYNTKIILGLFFSKARLIFSKMINPELLIVLTVPIRLRKRLIKQFKRFLRKKYINVTFKVNSQKTFNGCRPAKKVRKKRRKFRLFKKI